ncbi:MAG TPA: MBG domain-containing protein, partial [Candidatus Acidoferrales bacterium]|nr:MBG domain-containing protein [Candidatus Acidoferrales bacterium]
MKAWLLAALLLTFAFVLPSMAQAQGGFVYVNNQSSSNSVAAYKASAAGTLTQISGSPFLTGGVGASETCYGLSRMAVSPVNNLLFIANTGDKTITPFQINTTTGALTKAPGAPFASGLTADTCQGFSIAVTPDGQFLMAASNGQIRTFSVAATGALTFLSSTTNCCSPITGLTISPDGRFLAVSNGSSVSMYTIASGVLGLVPGSPFAKLGTGSLSAMDFSCIADANGNLRLYAGEATTTPTAEGWIVDPTGVLSPTTASPYHSSGTNSNDVLLSPDNTLLFQSNQSSTSINSFVVNPDGSIINSGKFGATGQVHTPTGMSIDQSGTFLYVADDLFGVAAFRIGDGGMLAWLQDLGITRPGQIRDVAAFPPRSCTTADVVLGVDAPTTAGAGVPIQYTVTVTNNGPATASAVVSDILPPELSAGGSTLIANPSGASRVNTDGTPNVTGAVTITTTVPHQLFPGEKVTVGSVPAPTTPNPIQQGFFLTDPSFNGVITVETVPSPTTFTYTQTIPRTQFPAPTLQIVASNGAQRIADTVTITATQVFQLPAGTPITVSGVANSTFNGNYVVASQPTANTFTYQQTGTLPDAVSGGGIVTAPINVPPTDTAGGGSMSSPACQISVGTGSCGAATFSPRPPIVTAIRSSNVVTITTTVPHLMTVGKKVTIQSVANTSFNGTFTITSVPSPTSFTYNQTAANASSTGGLVLAPGLLAQLVTLPNLTQNETRKVLITGTTASSIANGTVVSNRVTVSNLSVIDNPSGDTTVSKDVTIGSSGTSVITIPAATGPYGGTAIVTATLLDGNGVPIVGANVGFNFNQNNSQYNAVTDGSGVATASVPLGFTTVGTHANAFTATFGGDATHTGSSATADLIVTKAQLTVTADNQSRLYGDANPTLTYTITGFVNGDTSAVVSGTADCSTTATATSPVGTYPITCTQGTLAAQNYVFVFVDGTLTVNPAPLTVDVANASRAYGDPNPAFTGTITGIKNGDNITATYSTTATITSPVGTYPITASLSDNGTGALGNYTVTVNNGTLTVTPAALVVTANNAARLYGDPNPVFTGTIAGIKNGDNITAIYTTTATPASPVGTYPIIPTLSDNGTGALANYVVTANNGSLTVSPAPLTVTAADATRAFGQPNPVFTGTIVGIKNNDNITATYSTPATINSDPGTYPIIPTVSDNGTGVLGNYSVTINNGTLTITAAILTVTADNATRLYGDPNPVFTGTITGIVNGDNITATYASVATPASPVGTYPIVPTLSDNGTGALAHYQVVINNGTLTVNPAPLTVTVASLSRFYGDPNPVFTGTITGIKNGDNITATYSSVATQASPVGTYAIVATLVDPDSKLSNYTVTNTPGTLTVNPAPLVVTAANATRLYGDPNPAFTGTITGIKNGDNITAVYATTATVTSPVGSYPITPGLVDPGNKLGNYSVTLNNGTLTIAPAPLTVTAANATRGFGQPNPVFTGTVAGIKNGDNITATYSTPATVNSPAGTYPIIPTLSDNGTGALANYSVTVVNGTLTITQATLTVTANNASRLYGDPNPVFTGTITGIQNGDNITATYSTVADPTSPIGTYAIVPTLSDNGTGALANYTVVVNNGVLTVNPAPLTVTVDSFSRLYGDPNPVFTGSILGIKNGDAISATFATTADPTSPVGTYPIVATLVDPSNKLGNYTVTINNGTLTINPAPLTVTANNASRLFGTPNPPLSGTLTGVKNGDPITASFSTTATAASPVGAYPITPALADPAGKLGNYTVTSDSGTLTVNAAPTANFVFVNNQAASGNSINGYSVAVDGTLTALAGSPTLTGGLGANAACSSVNRLALSAGNNLLFVSNGGDQTISAFIIDPASGALTAAAGSPFASGLTLDACSGISLAATPDGNYLMASSNGQIKTFSIGVGGVLTAVSTTANSVAPNASMKISANGQFLAVSNGTSVSVYTINADGSL